MSALAVWEYPSAAAAVLLAIAVITKSAHWLYKAAGRMEQSLSYIEGEMRFNGGSTMRDAVKRIEQRLDVIEHNQEGTE